jgi:hypothetical protein
MRIGLVAARLRSKQVVLLRQHSRSAGVEGRSLMIFAAGDFVLALRLETSPGGWSSRVIKLHAERTLSDRQERTERTERTCPLFQI